eukprot:CAMPEP_0206037262 /NCGR_PEP_ID=MMETSP1466-20131121/3322_1 /ASSEMBLY_ACC=CAM_ASM_001126 /TAXON_ID=44452 /ORGANISM="Pavlova gyrans, Strain CCMP608" /LENGTH=646 /DNA_ID=CAMNT_0053411809 /DNA_START=51 /DNA_END=1991 /DNA_ORIENTATION=+
MQTSAFVSAMDAAADKALAQSKNKRRGENGAPEYTHDGAGDPRVVLFFKLVRDLSATDLQNHVQRVLQAHGESGDVQLLVDLIVIAFQTRATRGEGKGEKRLFRDMLLLLNQHYPSTVTAITELIPHYGYFKDRLLLAEELDAVVDESLKTSADTLSRHIVSLFAAKLTQDAAALKQAELHGTTPKLSLAAKWAPREGRHFSSLAKRVALEMYPSAPSTATARALYRKRVAALNKALSTTEVLMSAHRYAEIEWGRVASLSMNRHRKAFLNEKVKGKVDPSHDLTGNRFPDDEDRVAARASLRAMLQSKAAEKLKGAALQPHEIVAKILTTRSGLSTLEKDVFDAQWVTLRASVRDNLAKAAAAEAAAAGEPAAPKVAVDLGKLVPLVDVSGSMSGLPMQVAIALGILTSELTAPAFAHRFITFESKPRWVRLDAHQGICQKAASAKHAPWGGSTNFAAALELILSAAVDAKLKPDEIPDLIVFSDMQFNEANSNDREWDTHFERLQTRFAEAGERICGEAYPAPRIIFWNLRGSTNGMPAQSGSENVQLLSGFSPSLLKLVLTGADLVGDEVERTMADGTTKVVREGPTPYETLRKAVDDEAFDAVRAAIARVGEGPFARYDFGAPAAAEGAPAGGEDDAGFVAV